MDEAPKFRPTYAPDGWQGAVNGPPIYVETEEAAEDRQRAWREFAQPGQRVPLLWDDGVTLLQIVSVNDDGAIELRATKPDWPETATR